VAVSIRELAKKEESAVTGTYQLKDKSTGTFRFGFCGENTDRLIGTWSGRVSIKSESGVEKAVVYSDGLKLFAARNLSVNSECHKKQLPFGECPKNALETMQPLR